MYCYKSLGAAVMICAAVVNTRTHSQTYRRTDYDRIYYCLSSVQPAERKKTSGLKVGGRRTPCAPVNNASVILNH